MKKVKQNYQLNIAMTISIILAIVWLIISIVFCMIHVYWTSNGIETLGHYDDGMISYYTFEDGTITIESPYQSDLLEDKNVIVYYNKNKTDSCYIQDQIVLALCFGIVSFGFIFTALILNIIIRRKVKDQVEILKNGCTLLTTITDVEIVEDLDNNEFVIIHSKYLDPFNDKVYLFSSPKIKDKYLLKNPNVTGSLQVHYLKDNPDKYVVTAYEYFKIENETTN